MTQEEPIIQYPRRWEDDIRAAYSGYFTKYPECHPGWDAILREFFDTVVRSVPDPQDFRLLQIKEKFGELRIYYALGNVTDEVRQAVDAAYDLASTKSDTTCEVTGEPGVLINRQGYYCVRCERLMKPGDVIVKPRSENVE